MEDQTEFLQTFFRQAKKFKWQPQADITLMELAICVPGAAVCHVPNPTIEKFVESLSPECRRHFKEVKDE